MRWKVLTAVALGVGLVVSACGGGSSGLSEEEFVSLGNEICDGGKERIEALFATLGPDSTDQDVLEVVNAALDDVQAQVDSLRALDAPDSIDTAVTVLLDEADAVIDQMRADGLEAFAQETNPFDQVNRGLDALGLTTCAEE